MAREISGSRFRGAGEDRLRREVDVLAAQDLGHDPALRRHAPLAGPQPFEQEAWFSEFLNEGPSGHFRRSTPGVSPYVGRFMSADV